MIERGSPGPVLENERIESLDVLRGIAVLGILVTNIQHFAMFPGVTRNPTLYGDLHGANFWVYALTFVLVYQKFLPMFSMLFGAGIVLAAERREAAGLNPAALHYRRMGVLLAIALVHAYLIWYGDILFTYALCGMAVFLFRRKSARFLIVLGISTLAVAPLVRFFFFVLPAMAGSGGEQAALSIDEIIAEDLAAFRGEWIDSFRMRVRYSLETQGLGLASMLFWRAGGIMLIGMGLFKLQVFTGGRSRGFYTALIGIAALGAVPITIFGLWVNVVTNWENFFLRGLGFQIIYWIGIVMTLGWVGMVVLARKGGRPLGMTRPLATVGRMALTNYLLQSLICTFVFYGFGLGWYGSVERVGQTGVVIGVWAVLLVFSSLWLHYFRYGPVEWLWRTLAYGEVQPFLRGRAGPPVWQGSPRE